jgi:hypothetical protein
MKPLPFNDHYESFRRAVQWGFQMGLLSVRRSLLDICDTSNVKKQGSFGTISKSRVEKVDEQINSMKPSGD